MRIAIATNLLCVVLVAAFARSEQSPRPAEKFQANAAPSVTEEVDSFIRKLMLKRHIPGVSIAIVKDGKVTMAKGYGLANVELGVPATEHTIYQLASVTKTFTATAIMMLVHEGKIALDDKITERLPDLPSAWRMVTVRHLLNHTSGIKNYTSVQDFHKTLRKDYAPSEILDLVAKAPLEFTPGEKFAYCNTGYFLLGMLIEKVAGKPYGKFVDERIFKPLDMTHTRVNDLRAIIPDRAQGYSWDRKELKNGEYVSPTQPFAAGMLVSNVTDLTKWDAALANQTMLDGPTMERMWTATELSKGRETGYGFGWEVSKVNGHPRISHGGGIPGFSTELARFVDDKLTVIVLTNADGGYAGALARGIAGRFVPSLAEKAPEPIEDKDPTTTARLRGMFERAQKGEVDSEQFTDDARKQLVPRIKDDRERLALFGPLKSFQLLDRKSADDGVSLKYRAVFENETLKISIALDKAGKIKSVGLQPED